jgi:hypothetical protein
VDPSGEIVEYNSFRDRWNSFWLRVFDKEYREEFRELKRSEDIFVLNFNNEGKNSFTYDGQKTFINYSLTDKIKDAGETVFSLLRHETHHGWQLLQGELGFEYKEGGSGSIQIDGIWHNFKTWQPANYDVFDERDAHTIGAGNFTWKSGTFRDEFRGMSDSKKLDNIRERYPKIEQNLQLNNSVDEKIKDNRFYMYPYRSKLK